MQLIEERRKWYEIQDFRKRLLNIFRSQFLWNFWKLHYKNQIMFWIF